MLTITSALCNVILFVLINEMKGTKKQVAAYTGLLWLCCSVAFWAGTFLGMENVPASALFYTIPSLVVLYFGSKRKGFAFLLNFCISDMINLILSILSSAIAALITLPVLALPLYLVLMLGVLYLVSLVRVRYLEIQRISSKGWAILALNAALLYADLYLTLGYPIDIAQRPEYLPLLLLQMLLCVMFIAVVYTLFTMRLSSAAFEDMAYTDALTGIGNRAAFLRDSEVFTKDLAAQAPFFCVYSDINRLKKINDEQGHKMGDLYIKAAAEVLCGAFPRRETVYRVGGDEFFVFLRCRKNEDFSYFSGRIDAAVAQYNKTNDLSLSLAVGAARVDGILPGLTAEETLQQAIKAADQDMYRQKQAMKATR